ncbi:MAG: universal stress protein [Pikeienuella sp.]|uniref:universal stress protein n=1 Tax=Pikeienuella sp. TaxID=2831957 RepID=UPI00391C5924
MAFKSIVTVWDGKEESRTALRAATRLAGDASGHLDILCLGLDRTPVGYYSDAAMEVLDSFHKAAVTEAETRAAEAKRLMQAEVISSAVRTAAVRYAEIGRAVGDAAWHQDLVVLPKPYGPDGDETPEIVTEAALFESVTPVLVVPSEAVEPAPRRILVAWNGSAQAMRAVRAALPLLAAAEEVVIAVVDPGRHEANEADPGRALAVMLARHGAHAAISVIAETGPSVAHMLNRAAREAGMEMIVMGAYGHSRFRERLLGGATRDMLKTAEVPVLMAR